MGAERPRRLRYRSAVYIVAIAVLVAQVGAAEASPASSTPPCGPVVRGAALGAIGGAVLAPVLFAGSMIGLMAASGCEGEECEGMGLALYSLTVPSVGVGAIVGGGIGALIGVAMLGPPGTGTE